jgi:phenylalanyl-tRNA synthetase beta chain
MRVSLNWLRDYVKIEKSAEEIGEMLSDRGFPVEEIVHLGSDTMLNVEVTSNRGDCLSHIGVAREIAAATGQQLRLPQIKLNESGKKAADFVSVEIENPSLCGRYAARIIEGVKVGPTPGWMKDRLETIGIRSVNNIVDATNYAMMELGQPSHAFDYNKLQGGKIIVRNARNGETLISIDGTKCQLKENMLMIADANRAVAIAGVMGGLDSEISDSTTTVMLEAAHFAPLSVRTTARTLTIGSEASFRFERNVDIASADWASQRTAQLIVEVAGGSIACGMVDAYPAVHQQKKASMRLSRMKALLGIDIDANKVMGIFDSLGFSPVNNGQTIDCTIPSWRNDIYREVDLIEEVIRSYGYNKIHTEKKLNIEIAKIDPVQKFKVQMRSYLGAAGFYETISVTFTDKNMADPFNPAKDPQYAAVKDVSRKNANLLRPSLVGSLMLVFKSNYNAGNSSCRIYELADTFVKTDSQQLDEKMKLAMLCDCDFRLLKGTIEGLIYSINKNAKIDFQPCDFKWAKAAASVNVAGTNLGYIGVVSDDTCSKIDLKSVEPIIAELDFAALMSLQSGPVEVKPLPKFPSITRDLSIIVDNNVAWEQIETAVNKTKCPILEKVSFVDIYKGKPIPKDKKSVTLSLRFRDEDGTLTHQKVDEIESLIVSSLADTTGAELRKA